MAATATVTFPVLVDVGSKKIQVGEVSISVRVVNGKFKAPTEREIKSALRKVRFK